MYNMNWITNSMTFSADEYFASPWNFVALEEPNNRVDEQLPLLHSCLRTAV